MTSTDTTNKPFKIDKRRVYEAYKAVKSKGGPAGVGVAVGKAVRTAIVAINVIDFFLSMAMWGANTTVRLGG